MLSAIVPILPTYRVVIRALGVVSPALFALEGLPERGRWGGLAVLGTQAACNGRSRRVGEQVGGRRSAGQAKQQI